MFDYSIVEPIELKPTHYIWSGRKAELTFNPCEVALAVRLAQFDYPKRKPQPEPRSPDFIIQKPKSTGKIRHSQDEIWDTVTFPSIEATVHEAANAVLRFEKQDSCPTHSFFLQSNNCDFRLVCATCIKTLLLPQRQHWLQAFNDWLCDYGQALPNGAYARRGLETLETLKAV